MISADLSTSECDGKVIVALHGELDMADAASVAAIAASQPEIIVDVSRLKFIDSNGVAALARGGRRPGTPEMTCIQHNGRRRSDDGSTR